jgi:hypothetical protein
MSEGRDLKEAQSDLGRHQAPFSFVPHESSPAIKNELENQQWRKDGFMTQSRVSICIPRSNVIIDTCNDQPFAIISRDSSYTLFDAANFNRFLSAMAITYLSIIAASEARIYRNDAFGDMPWEK